MKNYNFYIYIFRNLPKEVEAVAPPESQQHSGFAGRALVFNDEKKSELVNEPQKISDPNNLIYVANQSNDNLYDIDWDDVDGENIDVTMEEAGQNLWKKKLNFDDDDK